jgi:hypothetical protein
MQSLNRALSAFKVFNPTPPAPSPAQAFAVSDLVGRIANTLDGDGSWIADGSLDTGGMTIVCGGLLYRVEVTYQGPFDANLLQEQIDRDEMRKQDNEEYARHVLAEDKRRNMEEDGNDAHDAYIGGRDFDDATYEEPEF